MEIEIENKGDFFKKVSQEGMIQTKMIDLKRKNHEYMHEIRRKNRKDQISNKRVKNIYDLKNSSLNSFIHNPNESFPPEYSHLKKVKDAQKIYQILQEEQPIITNVEELQHVLNLIKHGDRIQKHIAIIQLRKALCNQNFLPIQETIDYEGIPILIDLAQNPEELHLKLEATWCLANLATGNSSTTKFLVQKNLIKIFVSLLDEIYPQIIEQAIWGLGNIIADSKEFKKLVLNMNVVSKFFSLLETFEDITLIKNVYWAMSNICKTTKSKKNSLELNKILNQMLKAFIKYDDKVIEKECILSLAHHSDKVKETKFTEYKFIKKLQKYYQKLISCDEVSLETEIEITSIHKILGKISNGDDFDTNKIIQTGFLSDFIIALNLDYPLCKLEVCKILSNIGAGTSGQISHILQETYLFEKLISFIFLDDYELKKESIWTICNMTDSCNKEQLQLLISYNVLGIFSDIIKTQDDENILLLILEAIENLIDKTIKYYESKNLIIDLMYEIGLADQIEDLQRHQSESIYNQCIYILEEYFDLEQI